MDREIHEMYLLFLGRWLHLCFNRDSCCVSGRIMIFFLFFFGNSNMDTKVSIDAVYSKGWTVMDNICSIFCTILTLLNSPLYWIPVHRDTIRFHQWEPFAHNLEGKREVKILFSGGNCKQTNGHQIADVGLTNIFLTVIHPDALDSWDHRQ